MSIIIVGAGGHAKVVADIALSLGLDVAGFVDDNTETWNSARVGLPVLGPVDRIHDLCRPSGLICAVGSNAARRELVERIGRSYAEKWINLVHPSAVIGRGVRLGHDVVIAADAVVNVDTNIGHHTIINTGATIDHDCDIGDYAHISPGCHLAGGVLVGVGTLVGVGAAVIPYKSIGAWSIIGAGATVVRDIPAGVTAIGTPARRQE